MSTASQTQKNKDNLFLTLSPKLIISLSTTNQVNIKNVPENVTIELVRKYRYVGLHKLQRKAVIHLSYAEFLQLKSSTNWIHSFLNFIGNRVKCLVEAADERQHHASEFSTNPQTRNFIW